MKCPELSKEFGDVFRNWLASKPTAAEGPDVHLAADAGVLPYREKSVAREIQNTMSDLCRYHRAVQQVPHPLQQQEYRSASSPEVAPLSCLCTDILYWVFIY